MSAHTPAHDRHDTPEGHGSHGSHEGHGSHRDHGGHGHTATDADWETLATHLETGAELHLPAYRDTATRLRALLGPGHPVRRVLD
ncbi:SAM-dependent methyltransferase, partial [Streptomyces sp. NPDC048551]